VTLQLLLDSNIVIPLLDGQGRALPGPILKILHQEDTELWASVASIWEVSIKHRLGRLVLPCPLELWPEALSASNIRILDITTGHAVASLDPLPGTKDPFDRLLLAVCGVEGMKLLTVDRALQDHPNAWRA
jgi:PIN domain nuclease of toxin-antitoxin system